MTEAEVLNHQLFQAVQMHDLESIRALMARGADPFANAGCVELYVIRQNWNVRLASGCAAAQAIQWPHILDLLLPDKMNGWPMVTQATNVYGITCKKGQAVDLAQWAIEICALPSLQLLIDRLDRTQPQSEKSLSRLAMSCLAGCSHESAPDDALKALTMCMAAQPDLDRWWSHWRHSKLMSQGKNHEPIYMPMTFVMGSVARRLCADGDSATQALAAFAWALSHDDCVRSGDRRMGSTTEDTVLHLAAASGCIPLLRICLAQGCALDCEDAQGLTPLALAHSCGQSESVALIEGWHSKVAMDQLLNLNALFESELV
jgi:hypothetical protein